MKASERNNMKKILFCTLWALGVLWISFYLGRDTIYNAVNLPWWFAPALYTMVVVAIAPAFIFIVRDDREGKGSGRGT